MILNVKASEADETELVLMFDSEWASQLRCRTPHEHVTKTSGCRSPWEQMFSSSCAVSDVRDAQAPLSVCVRSRGFEQVVGMLSSHCVWCVSGSCPSELRDASAAFLVRQKRDQAGRGRKVVDGNRRESENEEMRQVKR